MTNCISEKKFVSLFTCHVYPHRQYRGADDNFKIIFFSQQLIYNILLKGWASTASHVLDHVQVL